MSKRKLVFTLLQENIGVCKLDAGVEIPMWAYQGTFFSITKTADELSIVCPEIIVPEGVLCEKGWKVLKIEGTLDFGLVGILAMVSTALANVSVSIFAISTYNTDYILLKAGDLYRAVNILKNEGHEVMA